MLIIHFFILKLYLIFKFIKLLKQLYFHINKFSFISYQIVKALDPFSLFFILNLHLNVPFGIKFILIF